MDSWRDYDLCWKKEANVSRVRTTADIRAKIRGTIGINNTPEAKPSNLKGNQWYFHICFSSVNSYWRLPDALILRLNQFRGYL